MAITLLATISDQFANSYCTVAYADSYFENHWDTTKATAWDALDDGPKQMLLVQATMMIEKFRFVYPAAEYEDSLHYDRHAGVVRNVLSVDYPIRHTWNQKLQFPRNLDVDTTTGESYIIEDIMIAQCEQAITLRNFSEAATAQVLGGIKRELVEIPGAIKNDITFQDAASMSQVISASTMSPIAMQYLSQYFVNSTTIKRS